MAGRSAIEFEMGFNLGPLRAGAREANAIMASTFKSINANAARLGRISAPAVSGIAKGLTSGMGAAVSGMKILTAGAAAAGAALAVGVDRAYQMGAEMDELSDRTGVAAGKLLVLRQAFKDSGIEAEQVGASINKMQRFLDRATSGTGAEAAALNALGVSLAQIQALAPDEQFAAIGRAIARVPDASRRAAVAMEIFGRTGGKFLSLFASGGSLEAAARVVGAQARLLDENSKVFHAVADRLNRVGLKFQGFFVGVAARVQTVLLPLLDKFEKLDFAKLGGQIGDSIIRGVQFFVGAFNSPQLFTEALVSAFTTAALTAGNVLIGVLSLASDFFKKGLVSAIQGVGDVLLGVLTKVFDPLIARFQAVMESFIQKLPSQITGIDYRDEGEEETLKKRVARLQEIIAHPERSSVREQLDVDPLGGHAGQLAAAQARLANLDSMPVRKSLDQLLKEYLGQGTKIQLGDQQLTPDQTIARGIQEVNEGGVDAAAAFKNFQIKDVLGAGAYAAKTQALFTKVANAGKGPLNKILDFTPRLNGKEVSHKYEEQLRGIVGHHRANEILYGEQEAQLLNQRDDKPTGAKYREQLTGIYGAKRAAEMLTTSGALIQPFQVPGALAAGLRNFQAPAAVASMLKAGGLTTGGLTTGHLGGGAYGGFSSVGTVGMIRSASQAKRDRETAKQKDEDNKKKTLEGTNDLLSTMSRTLDSIDDSLG